MFWCVESLSILQVGPYFDEPRGPVKIEMLIKNTKQYFIHTKTSNKSLIIQLLLFLPSVSAHFSQVGKSKVKREAWPAQLTSETVFFTVQNNHCTIW